MMTEKLNRQSIRLPAYDYSQPGAYFITICTFQKRPIFGEIREGGINLNFAGKVAEAQIQRFHQRFLNLEILTFVIMPNHVHLLLEIADHRRGKASHTNSMESASIRRAPTEDFGKPQPGSIPTIVRSYKSSVSYRIKGIRNIAEDKIWQRNYYEHVIKDEVDLQNTYDYIDTNPQNWENDPERD